MAFHILKVIQLLGRKQKRGLSISLKFFESKTMDFFLYSTSSTTESRMSTPGIHTTPQTPPTYLFDRISVISTLPDGLNHALSQENIRLQQIVFEHKVRV